MYENELNFIEHLEFIIRTYKRPVKQTNQNITLETLEAKIANIKLEDVLDELTGDSDSMKDIKDEIEKLEYYNRLKRIIFYYTKLKSLLVNSGITSLLSKELIDKFNDLENIIMYLLAKYNILKIDIIKTLVKSIEEFLVDLTEYLSQKM